MLRVDKEPEKISETTLRYAPYMEFDDFPVTTMEDAFPFISSLYG